MKIDRRIPAILLIAITITLAVIGSNIRLAAGVVSGQAGEVWVTHQSADTISILHPVLAVQGGAVETISLPGGSHPHIITFSPDGKFAYVANMGDGSLVVFNATSRQILNSMNFGPTLTHQAKPSPDGSVLLVSQIATKTLFKVVVDESRPSWSLMGSLSLGSILKAPVCSIFRDDGLRAYVSLLPSGIAIIDVPTMSLLGTLPTDGFIACGMIKSHDGGRVFIASAGSGGHLYELDTATDTLIDTGHTIGAGSWHSFNISPDEKTGFGTSPLVDQLQIINLATGSSFPLSLNPSEVVGGDQPDAVAVQGTNVYVSLRVSGKLAVINIQGQSVDYLRLEQPSASINPANCMGCALHGVTVRPGATTTSLQSSPQSAMVNLGLRLPMLMHHVLANSAAGKWSNPSTTGSMDCG